MSEILEKSDSLEKLETVDFSKDALDVNEAYNAIKDFKAQYEDLKKLESENIIEELGPIYLQEGFLDNFTKERENLKNYIRKYDPNLEEVKNMTSEEADKVYQIANYLFNVWQMKLNSMEALFELTDEEFKLIDDALSHKIEFDINEALNLADLKENWLNKAEEVAKGGTKKVVTTIEIGKCVILYHLISKYKVKGSGKPFWLMLSIIKKIGDINKLFNAFNIIKERLSGDFQLWGAALPLDEKLEPQPIKPNEM